ncbi:hypothetical protein C8R43DRAFT_951856 [Mycena crocata]|nr:hypothetical protein C8R43DRAFT_951856 [Mycena crocata]
MFPGGAMKEEVGSSFTGCAAEVAGWTRQQVQCDQRSRLQAAARPVQFAPYMKVALASSQPLAEHLIHTYAAAEMRLVFKYYPLCPYEEHEIAESRKRSSGRTIPEKSEHKPSNLVARFW